VRVLLRFEDHAGLFLYHCHMLEHEDTGPMRKYRGVAGAYGYTARLGSASASGRQALSPRRSKAANARFHLKFGDATVTEISTVGR